MPSPGATDDQIGYADLQQEALRGVVRAALKRIAADGMPGAHQFQITFKTKAPGVSGPPEVLARYPDEMMVVFVPQQFRDLAPGETYFSVTLSFGGQPRALSVPYAAITQFVDPSVGYRLLFSVAEAPPAPPPAERPARADVDPDKPNIVSLDQFRKK
jgi:uncharacterized protein